MNSAVGPVNSDFVSCTVNLCDVTVHALRKKKKKSQKTQQHKRRRPIQTAPETLFSLRESEPEFYSDNVIKSIILVSSSTYFSLVKVIEIETCTYLKI